MINLDISKNIRNPLGVIALFITFIYAIASTFFSLTLDKLEFSERIIIISFIVLFPFAILIVFYKLVTTHHGKLYSPGDFKNDETFLKLFDNLSINEIEDKYKLEYEKLNITGIIDENVHPSENLQVKPEILEKKSNRPSFEELKKIEERAIKYFESEYKTSIYRNVKLGNTNISFDGLGFLNKTPLFIEVKYLNRPSFPLLSFREAIYRSIAAQNYFIDKNKDNYSLDVTLYFILVGDFNSSNLSSLIDKYKNEYKSDNLDIKILLWNSYLFENV